MKCTQLMGIVHKPLKNELTKPSITVSNKQNIKYLEDYNKIIMPRLEELIEPLNVLGIKYFSYMKIIDDKKMYRVGNHPELNKKFIELQLYEKIRLSNWPKLNEKRIIPHYRLWNVESHSYTDKVRHELNMGLGITVYRTTKLYKESWAFCGSEDMGEVVNFIINNYNLLLKFIVYFNTVATDITDVSDERKLIDVNLTNDGGNFKHNAKALISAYNRMLKKSRYCIDSPHGQFWLTSREVQLLRYRSMGGSAKLIARKLDISYRTVENMLNNINLKSPMSNLTETIKICDEQGIL